MLCHPGLVETLHVNTVNYRPINNLMKAKTVTFQYEHSCTLYCKLNIQSQLV